MRIHRNPRAVSVVRAYAASSGLGVALGILVGCSTDGGESVSSATPPTPQSAGASAAIVPQGSSGTQQRASGITVDSILSESTPVGASQSSDGRIVIRHGFLPPVPTAIAPAGHG